LFQQWKIAVWSSSPLTALDEHILALGDEDLRALAMALRSGRLSLPITDVSLSHVLGGPANPLASAALRAWAAKDLDAQKLAWIIDLIAGSRKQQAKVEDLIELVLTSPEVPGVPARETAAVVHEMFAQATATVIVAGYTVQKGQRVFRALADRMRVIPHLKVQIFLNVQREYGDEAHSSALIADFAEHFKRAEWPDRDVLPKVYYFAPSIAGAAGRRRSCLHAKIVVVDRRLTFVSSANFTEAAHERNVEVGVLLRSNFHADLLSRYFETLSDAGLFPQMI
jgi:phosphatidylserine/phosphatidylglycerophosphate/cardiolipin synthase-like enzyme